MDQTQKEFFLSANEIFLFENKSVSIRVNKGTVCVYILPTHNSVTGDPKLLCTVSDTDKHRTIPPFLYEDASKTYWQFQIKADCSDVALEYTTPPTSILYRNFLKNHNINTSDGLDFEQILVTFYQEEISSVEQENTIIITHEKSFLSDNLTDAYILEKGHVFVEIITMLNGQPIHPKPYCEIKDSEKHRTIPAFTAITPEGKKLHLQVRSVGPKAILRRLPNGATSILHQKFLERKRIETYHQEGFVNSLVDFYVDAGVVIPPPLSDKHLKHYQAFEFACRMAHIPLVEEKDIIKQCGKRPGILEIAKASNIICRKVILDAEWFKSDCGTFIGTIDKNIIACAPDKNGRYLLFHAADNSTVPLTEELARTISPQAYSLGRTLPPRSLSKADIYAFCRKSIKLQDLTPYIILVLFCSLIGILLPTLNGMVYDDYIPVGNVGNLTQLCIVMLSFMLGNISFSIVKNLFGYRIISRVNIDLQNAVYHRLFHLPESFFRKYDSADIAGRVSGIGATAARYVNTLVISSISALFSVFYLIRMFTYNVKLTWISIAIYIVYLLIITAITSTARKGQVRIAEIESECSSKLYQYLNGIDKIRMAGVEETAMLSYMKPYVKQQYEEVRVNRLVSIEEALTTVISSVFSMILYWYIVKKLQADAFSVGSFVAFNSAFGAFTGALGSLVDEALALLQENKEIDRFWPVFEAVPEDDDSKELPGMLSGKISLEHVSFAYSKESKTILNDVSIDIHPGDYVAIVGPSGCGKSTLLKLILGFESPQAGRVVVDDKDLRVLNKGAYRRQLGVVLQNGKLIAGSIHENITITTPNATMAQVNEVVQQVGLKNDIDNMPMGLNTMLSENCNTVSGGQLQRILIARAICNKPKILIFDEATSALDNATQAVVCENLDKMPSTKIVVAHRLSTIKNCDRIFVMDQGKIVQQGTYKTLMQDKNGLFYSLASRQIAE